MMIVLFETNAISRAIHVLKVFRNQRSGIRTNNEVENTQEMKEISHRDKRLDM